MVAGAQHAVCWSFGRQQGQKDVAEWLHLSRLLLILAALICSSESSSYCTVLTFFMTSAPQQGQLIAECLCMPTHSLHFPALSGPL